MAQSFSEHLIEAVMTAPATKVAIPFRAWAKPIDITLHANGEITARQGEWARLDKLPKQ